MAKTNAEHSKQLTKNKTYQAPWTSRICDVLVSLRKEFDSEKSMESLTKSYVNACTSPKPASQGLNFEDVYLDNSFEIKERKLENDSYVRIPHSYKILAKYFENKRYSFREHLHKLEKFVAGFFY